MQAHSRFYDNSSHADRFYTVTPYRMTDSFIIQRHSWTALYSFLCQVSANRKRSVLTQPTIYT